MLFTYVSSCITWFQDLAIKLLKKDIKAFRLLSKEDGFLIYQSSSSNSSIASLPYINNSFLLLHTAQKLFPSLEHYVKELLALKHQRKQQLIPFKQKKIKVRLMSYVENQPTKINKTLQKQLEKEILSCSRNFILDTANPDIEFWLSKRANEPQRFLLRLTKKNATKDVKKGEIRPEFSYFVNTLWELSSEDVIIDPFVGYGSFPKSLLKYFPHKKIIVNDLQSSLIQELKQELKNQNLVFLNKDVRTICFKDYKITTVITDPPWGLFEVLYPSVEKFYEMFIHKCATELPVNGKLVLCTYQKEIVKSLLIKYNFVIKKEIHTLLSGKKVVIVMAFLSNWNS